MCKRLQCLSARVGICKLYSIDFVRASFVTWAQQAGLNNEVISTRTDHSTKSSMKGYSDPAVQQQQTLSNILQKF